MLLRAAAAAVAHRLLVIHPVRRIASLKVPWRRDEALDASINRDRRFRLASRLVREVLLSPDRRLLLRYLAKRRERIRLPVHVQTFLRRYPTLLSVSAPPDPVASPSPQLLSYLESASRLQATHAPLLASRLAKLLMISSTRALPVAKIAAAKRDFGLPDDFLVSLVPRYPDLFRLVGDPGPDASGNAFLELASWDDRLAKSVIESRADREAEVVGIRPRPNFTVKLPKGFYLKKEMRDWVRDWLELPYVSPYADTFGLNPASPEAEKRLIGVLHEVLSLSVERRMAVPIIGKFCEEFKLSNAFSNAFTRHPGIFYVSLKGGIKTVVLREAYDENGVLVDRDPMIELKERFMAIMDEGHRKYLEDLRRKNERLQKERENATRKGTNAVKNIEEESMEESEEDESKEYDSAQVDSEGRKLL
ncbi:protein WHAT'S THIS FACTOR 1, chloroplastic [Lolium perenne]|uniref:protein WHAT'S THIS FACTOR 1, chloroplastic n=1 Tax=Lolium perenne TaxID=4522 RepID=UPI0021F51CCF|nr:protein WHAT'S THIS FACTOR 1 homolog, chloroplastic [Lolium perenne]XP_051178001.1 protein WHAT'S THIS FACTOR 1 homolog, chloroplastic [Lolium perenne]XP_051178002.1 protein WHAT'S THIS FACTOR 1 homolog, chloroplastic [Lolium perenne]XP_051178003.1 protein WHAT'S THIS FACTOR 1 homolog, chloroplastic [Lolium perenne]XP_051178004.1 protein WHAT'S THIS FACTOR 1 homolog, chloroplastic [Lolium perenne]XP_051178005.1 protein WHAT'S THIS FACTOR 1 homolog, chloroplastic [Lolium perenne]XP_05117800